MRSAADRAENAFIDAANTFVVRMLESVLPDQNSLRYLSDAAFEGAVVLQIEELIQAREKLRGHNFRQRGFMSSAPPDDDALRQAFEHGVEGEGRQQK